jgi:fructan beta-fructosidase
VTKWVLIVSINPGGPAGGSGTQYFVGDFDGRRFTLGSSHPAEGALWVDYGSDFYAAVTWSNVPDSDGRRILLG